MKIAGWHAPTHDPDAPKARRDPAGSPNFFADFEAPVPFAEVADLAVRTLAGTLEVTHPDLLEYAACDADGNPLSGVIVQGFVTATDAYVGEVQSLTDGTYILGTETVAGTAHYLVAFLAGSPNRAAASDNTILSTNVDGS